MRHRQHLKVAVGCYCYPIPIPQYIPRTTPHTFHKNGRHLHHCSIQSNLEKIIPSISRVPPIIIHQQRNTSASSSSSSFSRSGRFLQKRQQEMEILEKKFKDFCFEISYTADQLLLASEPGRMKLKRAVSDDSSQLRPISVAVAVAVAASDHRSFVCRLKRFVTSRYVACLIIHHTVIAAVGSAERREAF